MDKIICPNCGAAIEVMEPKCPFCGYINIPGAEEKFMQDLGQTEEQLSKIPQMQKEQIKRSIFKSSRVIWITILIVILIAVIIVGAHLAIESVVYDDSEYDAKAEMIWERENYPLLDEMYAAGDYDGIVEFESDLYEINEKENTNHSIYNWEHADFISIYVRIEEMKDYVELLDAGEELSKYQAHGIVYDCMWFHYRMYQDTYMRLSEKELKIVEEYREYSEEIFYNRLKFTDEEADRLYEESSDYGVLSARACFDYAEQIQDRIE